VTVTNATYSGWLLMIVVLDCTRGDDPHPVKKGSLYK